MTPTRFLCLANSRKYTQRCIAGIQLLPTPRGKHNVARLENGNPRWIRPVSQSASGEVSEESVKHIKLLDMVEVTVTDAAPVGHQQENLYFDDETVTVLRSIPPDPTVMDKLVSAAPNGLFGDEGIAIPVESAVGLDHSLLLVKVENPAPRFEITASGRVQTRLNFTFQGADYNLPITDIDFRLRYHKDPFLLQSARRVYCTISLGQPYHGYYYKLVAGVIYC